MNYKIIIILFLFGCLGINIFSETLNVILGYYYPDVYIKEGEITGFAVELLKEIENDSTLKFDIVVKNWGEAYSDFISSDYYDLIGLIVPNKERKNQLKFYKNIITITPFVMTLYDNNYSYDELKKFSVGVLRESFLLDVLQREGFEDIKIFETNEEIIDELLRNEISSAALEDERIVNSYLILHDLHPHIRYVKIFDSYPLTFGSKKENEKPALNVFEDALKKVLKSEDYKLLTQKWMGIASTLALEQQKMLSERLILFIICLSILFIILVILYQRNKNILKVLKNTNLKLNDSYNEISSLNKKNEILNQKLTKMYKIFYDFTKDYDTTTILNGIIEELVNMIPEADCGSIGVVRGDQWKIIAAHGFPDEIYNFTLPFENVIKVGSHVKEVKNLSSHNINIPNSQKDILKKVGAYEIKNSLFMDLRDSQKFVGNISVSTKVNIEFSESSKQIMEIFARLIEIFMDLKLKEKEAIDAYNYSLTKLTIVAERFDSETSDHMNRICDISYALAKKLGLDEEFSQKIKTYAYYHDIGKILIPIEILKKTGKLNPSEWEIIKKHPEYGADIIGNAEILKVAKNIALYHHERYDGNGYPYGLKGEEIPIEARIVSLVDVYDALRSERPYKRSLSHIESINIILNGDDRTTPAQFDPEILKVFIEVVEKFKNRY
ncbi:HD domain-containing phosphohydrolase [Petrotoga sp. 9PWA.NaAc.5.4]|uniref:HD domain-containing phosphohydrolase n=1 Tax=Petrotoga sp. 9PWA.NaAc.5.4 TaxID=1434328 RepID=UPI000CAD7058|nr:HD domain-containing phosphohydrolase [Petrotoga sp. 9PWA.NaAc.5.4]PNR95855.1 hypothetical protein X924_03705 [Petrotoga sp. 9PWA.NaAc.5.4]